MAIRSGAQGEQLAAATEAYGLSPGEAATVLADHRCPAHVLLDTLDARCDGVTEAVVALAGTAGVDADSIDAWLNPVEPITPPVARWGGLDLGDAAELLASLPDPQTAGVAVGLTFGIPEARRFCSDGAVLTPLGPRDAAWSDAVIADPVHAADAFPWWELGPGREERSHALVALALEVPWREPLDGDERDLMTKVDEDLRAARKADAALALPWPEWKELLLHLGVDDEDVTAKAGDRAPSLGYRRLDLEVELSGGWRVQIPGGMVGHWEDDGGRYWATDGDRAIEFTSLTADGETEAPCRRRLFSRKC